MMKLLSLIDKDTVIEIRGKNIWVFLFIFYNFFY
jgi:hypothetical protein